jgi:uncharacterized protein DUF6962
MSEPITAGTDYLLAAIAAYWALMLARRANRGEPIVFFAISFGATAFGALLGGLYHQFHGMLSPFAVEALWKSGVLCIGVASYCLGSSIAMAFVSPAMARLTRIILLLQLCAFIVGSMLTDEFWIVIADYGSVMLAILALCIVRWRHIAARWIGTGVIVSFAAAGLQMGSFAAGPLNHNDLYHLVEIAGLFCLFQGGKRL